MVQNSKQIQTQSQQQTQTLSPQQILAVKLIELPAVELEDKVRSELLENPALEQLKDSDDGNIDEMDADHAAESESEEQEYNSLDDYGSEDDIPDYKLQEHNNTRGGNGEEIPFSDSTSFFENLKEQLAEQPVSGKVQEIAEYIIGSLDDDGLLRKPLSTISDELAIYCGVDATEKEIGKALEMIQTFDPAGVGARSLQECLLIQIRRKKSEDGQDEGLLALQETVLRDFYDEFTHKHWDKIIAKLGVDKNLFDEAIKKITKLNPKPGTAMGDSMGKNLQQITPEFIVETDNNGHVSMSLNNNVPELRINRDFSDLLEEQQQQKADGKAGNGKRDAMLFLKQKIESAQRFIDAIKQRQYTLTATMQAIIDLQRPFFTEGDESLLRPMILKNVADRTNLDISTISRVSNSKYVQTDFGIYPLKFFFSDGYTTQDGEEKSIREIKAILKETISSEDKSKPFTDDELVGLLSAKGYPMARRTIAKYRQQMNIPVARLRK